MISNYEEIFQGEFEKAIASGHGTTGSPDFLIIRVSKSSSVFAKEFHTAFRDKNALNFCVFVIYSKNDRISKKSMMPSTKNRDEHASHITVTSTEPISTSLRYFSVRNRSDGTQSVEEREITLRRSLYDNNRKLDLSKEEDRLKTLENWKYDKIVRREHLAARGFTYLGDGDRVQCVFCKGILRDWRPGDEALAEHHKHFPTCPFILRLDVGNIPLPNQYGNLKVATPSTDTAPAVYKPCATSHDVTASVVAFRMRQHRMEVKHPHLIELTKRIDTFRDNKKMLPNWAVFDACAAGFFRSSEEPMDLDNEEENKNDAESDSEIPDDVILRCYACDLRVDSKSVPPNRSGPWWEHHAKYSRHCPHLKMNCNADSLKRLSDDKTSVAVSQEVLSLSNKRHRIEPREVRARLDLPMYCKLQKLLLPKLQKISNCREMLFYIICERLEIIGKDFESLYDALDQLDTLANEYIKFRNEFPELSVAKFLVEKKEEEERRKEELRLRNMRRQTEVERSLATSDNPLNDMNEQELSEFNRQLKDNRTCKICMDNTVDTVFLPCGHLVTCHDCAPKVKQCPVCRLVIASTVLTTL